MIRKVGKKFVVTVYDASRPSKKRHVGTYASKTEARNKEAADRLTNRPKGRETCDHFVARWMDDYAATRPRLASRMSHREHTVRFARDFKGVGLADIDRATARAWALKHPGDHAAVRAMFNDAKEDGLVLVNQFANLRMRQSRGRKDIIALTEEELVALADLALDPRMELGDFAREYRAMVLFAGYVGCRPGETWGAERPDIRGNHFAVDRSYSSKSRETTLPKNGRKRLIILPPPAAEALDDVPLHDSGLLFESIRGKQWTQSLHNHYWTRLRLIANRPGFDFYELRHAAATMLIERGVTPWDVAIQLGHTDGGKLVMELYGHPAEAAVRARLLAAWSPDVAPLHAVTDLSRRQAS